MVFTRKFSQFVPQAVTSVVGLTAGANSIGPNGGGGGGGAVTQEIIQANNFQVGEWIRFDVATNLYARALATTPLLAEVIGVVILADPTKFTVQQAGYVTIAQAVFPVLTPGEPQFLSDVTLGAMTANDVLIDGEVSKPLFIPDKTDGTHSSGWVIPLERGIIAGGGPDTGIPGPTPPGGTDTSIVTVSQNGHGLNVGDWVRVETPLVGPPKQEHYVRALADTLDNAQAVGVVIQVIDANTFRLQFSGYVSGTGPTTFAPFQDQVPAALVPKVVYYLSSTVPGQLTSNDPGLIGAFSKPLYIPSQTPATVTTQAGYILPQRPLGAAEDDNPVVHTVVEANTFSVGQWVYISGDHAAPPSYALAQADTLARAQVAGVIIAASPTQFSVQQSGWIKGAITGSHIDGGGPVASSVVYYLSQTTPGNITTTVPTTGQVSKPCYVQEDVATHTGEILPQRPLTVAATASNPVTHTVVQANTFSVGQWVYIDHDLAVANAYQLAKADTLAHAQVAGVIIAASPTQFTVQQSGYIDGAILGAFIDGGGPVQSGPVYYLSLTTAGNISLTVPAVGQISKPCYVQEAVGTHTGEILPQRPLVLPNPSPGGGTIVQLQYVEFRGIATIGVSQISQLDIPITLSNAANSVLITFTITFRSGTVSPDVFQITRNGVTIPGAQNTTSAGATSGAAGGMGTVAAGADCFQTTSFTYKDTPGAVGPFTYGVKLSFTAGTFFLNTDGLGTYGISTGVLMEIG